MGRSQIYLKNGIVVEHGRLRFALDPRRPVKADYTFVSHAHLDHMHNPSAKNGAVVMASKETRKLALARGYDLGETIEHLEGVRLLDSGHVLGARAICIGDEVLYTGDAAGRERAFLTRCKTKKAKTLIVETTFGSAEYVFPPLHTMVKEVNELIGRCFDMGRPVVLMGYPLGKAQVLSSLFSAWGPLYVHERVAQVSKAYRECGVKMRDEREVKGTLEGLPPGPWVMVAPIMNRSETATRLKKSYDATLVAFSGWAMDRGYRSMIGADFAFPISDHCDHQELMRLVGDVSPETVFTTHGFMEEFARDLRREGYDAKPLDGYQSDLTDYGVD